MQPKKSLGQHWLFDEASLKAMLAAGEVSQSDTVLEVGPGLGTLTKKLCETAKQVIAVELDDTLAAELHQHLNRRHPELDSGSNKYGIAKSDTKSDWIPDQVRNDNLRHPEPVEGSSAERKQILKQVQDDKVNNLEVVHQSILDFDTSRLPAGYKVIANIPYYLTSNLIRRMLESPNPPSSMVLLVQKEVAERVAAGPGTMGILSVATQFYAEVALKELVPAKLFTPPPKVDSQIIQIKLRKQPLFPELDTQLFFQLVRAGFSEKRKKLRSALSGGLNKDKAEIDALLQKAAISPDARAQELSLQQWHQLHTAYLATKNAP